MLVSGLDFGTSNCAIGVWETNGPVVIPIDGENTFLPSAMYTSRKHVGLEEIDENELRKRVGLEKNNRTREKKKAAEDGRAIKDFSDEDLENIERGRMRREIAEKARKKFREQTISDALYADTDIVFGQEAINAHIHDSESGYFIKSPKSFLGADITDNHIELFTEVITRMMAHIKTQAEESVKGEINNVICGRPVNFHGTRGEEGNSQALRILERSAIAAGFDNISFLIEPVAAALDYERQLSGDLVALILDLGGGTTDCSMLKLGPSYVNMKNRDSTILGYSGDRVGGVDLDIKLAMRKIMPHFGRGTGLRDGLPIPNIIFWNAVAINDVNSQSDFYSMKTRRDIEEYVSLATEPEKLKRLEVLIEGRYGYRLNRSAEFAKIHLSDRDPINLPLRYIDSELVLPISRSELRDSIDQELYLFGSLMKDVVSQAGTAPDIIYVTGGTAKSPVVEDWIRSHFKDAEIVVGNLFGGVTSGLTTWAHRLYQ